ncbi:MAG TPA: DUF420 domain-containing protein [Pseudogracilibacillus sp.]|nr:DUF420 domain-containing protein [Pseudogracilibacillus sp.]
MNPKKNVTERNYKPMIVIITLVLIGTITALLRLPGVEDFDKFDVTILPMFNAIFNLFSFGFLSCALVAILRRNVKVHRRFIYAALVSTTLFLVNYVFFHFISSSTSFGGEGVLKGIYYFVLISHVLLAMIIIPLALTSITLAWNQKYETHKKVSRWTMPIWLYVSLSGVIVYLLIRPYY